jgi:TonB family protein
VLLERVDPIYPDAARRAGGTVALELEVHPDGSVDEVRVVKAAGFGFDEAAVAAARRFKFRPATRDGQPITAYASFARCGAIVAQRTGVTDVHFTPGVPFNLQLTLKAYF